MRKSIALLMLLGLTSTSLVACGGNDAGTEAEEDAVETPADPNAPAAAPADDGGEDDADEGGEGGEGGEG